MAAPYKIRAPGTLKAAIAQLIEKCGGQTRVADEVLHLSTAQVGRMTDQLHPKVLPRLDQIALLEAEAKDPVVTRYLAAQANCIVEPVSPDAHVNLPIVVGRITSETGALLSAAACDMQAGKLTKTNAATVLRETDDVVAAVCLLRAEAREVLNGGGA